VLPGRRCIPEMTAVLESSAPFAAVHFRESDMLFGDLFWP
jgi:hypothetical protein